MTVDEMQRLEAALEVAVGLVDGLERHVRERAAVIAEATIREVRAAADARVADAERLAADAEDRLRQLDRVARERNAAIHRADDLLLQLEAIRVERAALIAARNEAQRRADEADAARLQLRADLDSATAGGERLLAELETAITERDAASTGLSEACRLLETARVASWSPRAHPSRPLTAEQEQAAAAGECRTDWPTWVQPCDPAVSTDGDTLWLSCAGDAAANSEHPTPIVAVEPGDRWSELVAAVAPHRCGGDDVPRESG